MKRCPQCEFLYEDEQSQCDMDGSQLVLDVAPSQGEQNAAPLPIKQKRKSGWRLFAILAIPSVALGMALPITFQASRQATLQDIEPVSQNANFSGVTNELPVTAEPVPSASPVPSVDDKPAESTSPAVDKTSPALIKEAEEKTLRSKARARADSVARVNARAIGRARSQQGGIELVVVSSDRSGAFATQPVTPRQRETRTQATVTPKPAQEKKPSQLSTFLKKTGRILKKPFKL